MSRRTHAVAHLLSGDLWAGAESQAYHLIRALHRNGSYRLRALLLNEGLLASRLRRIGIPVEVAAEKGTSPFSLVRRVRAVLRRWSPSIVHSHGYKENILASLAMPVLRGRGLVRTQHGSPYPGGRPTVRLYYAMDRWFARRHFPFTIAVSEGIAGELGRFLPPKRIILVRNGIRLDDSIENGPDDFPFPGDPFIVLAVGRLAPEKRFDRLIDAVSSLLPKHPDLRLVLVGDGPERFALEERASRLLAGRVWFAGFREETGRFFRRADLFVLSSDREGLPMTLLEAFAWSLPVVSTPAGGIPELVRQGETGFLADDRSVAALAGAIEKVLVDREGAEEMGRAGRRLVEEEYSIDRVASGTETIYKMLEDGR